MMTCSAMTNIPMLAVILASLGLILAANRVTRNLSASVLLGTCALGLLGGHTPAGGIRVAAERLLSLDNFCLMLVIFLIIWLSTQMSAAGVMRDLVDAIRRRLGRRHAMAALPAVIGFLPMPGGAIFSAPLVDHCDDAGLVPAVYKARANYWFRHIWEFWWPLYPGVLLAMHITGLDVWQFILLGLPLSIAAIAAGYICLLRKIKPEPAAESALPQGTPLHQLLLPIFTVIAGYLMLRLALAGLSAWLPSLQTSNRYGPMIFGILLAMLVVERWRPLPWPVWKKTILSGRTINLALIVAAVRIYGAFIEAPLPDGDTPIAVMQGEMARWGIPLLAMIMLLPFLAGLTTGLAIGFVGASFPIVTSLLGPQPPLYVLLAYTMLAYACGHIGQMLSPVHVCLVVSNEHFKTNLFHSLSGIFAPAAAVIATAVIFHFVLLRFTGFP